MNTQRRQSFGQPGDSVKLPPPHQPRLLAVRLALVKLVLLMFLLFWPPRYDSPTAAGRASQPLPIMGAEEKASALKDDDAWQRGRVDRPLRQSRRRHRGRGRLVNSLATVCAVSTLLILLSVVVTIMTWHPGGWAQL